MDTLSEYSVRRLSGGNPPSKCLGTALSRPSSLTNASIGSSVPDMRTEE